jgi:hypothetical protein
VLIKEEERERELGVVYICQGKGRTSGCSLGHFGSVVLLFFRSGDGISPTQCGFQASSSTGILSQSILCRRSDFLFLQCSTQKLSS